MITKLPAPRGAHAGLVELLETALGEADQAGLFVVAAHVALALDLARSEEGSGNGE